MIRFVHILTTSVLLLCCCSRPSQKKEFRGEVKEVKEESFQLDTTQSKNVKLRKMRWKGGKRDFRLHLNSKGEPTLKEEYAADGTTHAAYEYRYDTIGQLASLLIYNNHRKLTTFHQYEYQNGLCMTETEFSPDSMIVLRHFNEHKEGNLVKQTTHYPIGGISHITTYHYDRNGRTLCETILAPDKTPVKSIQYSYNREGFKESERIENLMTNKNLSNRSYTYKYDSIGNWVECIEHFDSKPLYLLERTIGYN